MADKSTVMVELPIDIAEHYAAKDADRLSANGKALIGAIRTALDHLYEEV